jgi:hypothetical protein
LIENEDVGWYLGRGWTWWQFNGGAHVDEGRNFHKFHVFKFN